MWRWRRTSLGTQADRATYRTLHTALLASPPLRMGLGTAHRGRALAQAPACAPRGAGGRDDRHERAARVGRRAVAPRGPAGGHLGRHPRARAHDGRRRPDVACDEASCVVRQAIVAPLDVDEKVVGTLQVFTGQASAGLVRATNEVARWVSGQLELAELDASRTRLMVAEVRALRAQISPHFIYNSLTAIASFTRTDPERARELLLDLAEFTRYSFRRHGEFTTLAEELRSIEAYLAHREGPVRRPADGDPAGRPGGAAGRRAVPLPAAPRRERRAPRPRGRARATARSASSPQDADHECVDHRRGRRRGRGPRAGTPCARRRPRATRRARNVDERLRAAFGDDHGLVVETAPGAGTKVIVRLPKFPPGVHHDDGRPRPRVLAVDDEPPALDELVLLGRTTCVGEVVPAGSGEARCGCSTRRRSTPVFLDVQMPGLSGLDLARVLSRFSARHPSSSSRRTRSTPSTPSSSTWSTTCSSRCATSASTRPCVASCARSRPETAGEATGPADESIVVELAGVSRLVARSRRALRRGPG